MKIGHLASGGKHRLRLLIGIITLVALLLPALPAQAVYRGTLDTGNTYKNVGIIISEHSDPRNSPSLGGPKDVLVSYQQPCTGTLIAQNIVLANGCVGENWDDYAWFSPVFDYDPLYDYNNGADGIGDFAPDYSAIDPDPIPPLPLSGPKLSPWKQGDPICVRDDQPCYRGKVIKSSRSGHGPHDLVVLVLEGAGITDIAPAKLPAYESLNDYWKQGKLVTSVGYADLGCIGNDCPLDADDVSTWYENTLLTGRHFRFTQRAYATMNVVQGDCPASGCWPKDGNKYLTMHVLEDATQPGGYAYPCGDSGAPTLDDSGVVLAIMFDTDCSPQTSVLRLDTANAKNFLCGKSLAQQTSSQLATSALCTSGQQQQTDKHHHKDHKHGGGGKHQHNSHHHQH